MSRSKNSALITVQRLLFLNNSFSILYAAVLQYEEAASLMKRLLIKNKKYYYQNFQPKLTIGNLSSFDTV